MYSFDSRVRYSEVDQNQELSVAGILNYLQDCSTFQSEDLGLGIDYLEREHRAWWLSSWRIEILGRPRLGERIQISTWPYDFKGFYGYRNFTIRTPQGEYLVKADSVWFFFDTAAARPVRAEEKDIGGYLAEQSPRLSMEPSPRKIPLPENLQPGPEVTVLPHQIDTNHHVNNAQYVEIAREQLPEGLRPRQIWVDYKKAAVLGDKLFVQTGGEGDTHTVVLSAGNGSPYAVVRIRA